MRDPTQAIGFFASLRRLLATVLEIAQVRLDLLSTEFELGKRRFFDALLWGAIALLMLGVGVVLLCGFIVLLFWDGYRLAAVGVMAVLFLSGGWLMMQEARRRMQSPTGTFDTSLAELERDCASLDAGPSP